MKKLFLFIGLMIVVLFGSCVVFADPTVTLTVNGKTGTVTMPTQEEAVIVIQAPGATAIRFFDSNRWDPEADPTGDGCWDYYDRYNILNYLERYQGFGTWGAGYVVAEARYDDYEDGLDFWNETWAEGQSPWSVRSNTVTLDLTTNGLEMPDPNVTMNNTTATQGSWVKLEIQQTLGLNEWYWVDVSVQNEDPDGDPWLYLDHYDFDKANCLSIPVIGYEPGYYMLEIFTTAPGYDNNGKTTKYLTVTAAAVQNAFTADKTSAAVHETINFGIYAPDANGTALEITKEGNPAWFSHPEWDSGIVRDRIEFGESGTFQIVARNRDNGAVIGSQVFEITASGRLTQPDLSGLPVLMTPGQALTGTIVVDDLADYINTDIHYLSDDGEEYVYNTHREKGNTNWNVLNVPANVLSRTGRYRMHIAAESYSNYDAQGTNLLFIVRETPETGSLTLTANGSTQNITNWPSSTNIRVAASAENATAIRLLSQDGWWDYQDTPNGYYRWERGFGDGDYTLIAQMTTDEPVWRQDNFDWGNFRWEDLNWTEYSNAVKVHVTSQGELTEPVITLTPANGRVVRGDFITVSVAEQEHAQWIWAEMRRLNSDDPYYHYYEDMENAHFDSDGHSMIINIPTIQIEPGDYYLEVGVDAENWTGKQKYVQVTITEPAQPLEATMSFSKDTLQTNEGMKIIVWAPGLNNMDLRITRPDNPNWNEYRGTGREYEAWSWGTGSSGTYIFTLTIHYPENDQEIVKTMNVTADGRLEDPVLTGIPSVLNLGEGLNGSFQPVQGTEWYNVELNYIPFRENWEQLYQKNMDPMDPDSTVLSFSSDYFNRTGAYRLSVSACTVGVNNGFIEKFFVVSSPDQVSEDLILKVNGKTTFNESDEIYLYQELTVSLDVPNSVTAARVWNGREWRIWAGTEEGFSHHFNPSDEGTIAYMAQATTDQSVNDWALQHNNNFNGFDWSQVNWDLVSNSVSFSVTCLGQLDAPRVTFPDGTTVERGNELTVQFEGVENSAVYGVIIESMDGKYRFYDVEYMEPGTYSFLTDALPAETYRLIVEPRRYGYSAERHIQPVTITETNWQDEPVFRVQKTQVITNESFGMAVYAPGALEIRIMHQNNEWGYIDSSTLSKFISLKYADDYIIQAFARYSHDGDWVQVGEDITISATAPYGNLPITIEGDAISLAEDEYTFTISIDKMGVWFDELDIMLTDPNNEDGGNLLEQLHNAGQLDEDQINEDVFSITFTIAAGALPVGTYHVHVNVRTSAEGFEWSSMDDHFFLSNNSSDTILHNIDTTCVTERVYPIVISAPGAQHISMWRGKENPAPEIPNTLVVDGDGDIVKGLVVFASGVGKRYVTIKATYPDSSVETVHIEITATAPYGELYDPMIAMPGIWAQGQDLNFRVAPLTAKYIYVEIRDKETQTVVYADEEDRYDNWYYSIPASNFTFGKTYELEVTSTQEGYNYNQAVFDIYMVPSEMDTMILPADLQEIKANAFEGIKAQKIVIPEGVTSVANYAFADCPNLLLVELQTACEGIQTEAFAGSEPYMIYGYDGDGEFAFLIKEEGGTYIILD